MRNGNAIILLFLLLISSFCSHAQPADKYIFRHIDQSDGLLHNRVFSITQDSRGFIWLLSQNGLQRYDGYRFVNYLYDIYNPGGITYTDGCGLFADKKNNQLWIAHENLEKLETWKNKLTLYDPEKILQDTSFVFDTYRDSTGHRWLAGKAGVFQLDSTTKDKHSYLTASWLNPQSSSSFFDDQQSGEIWMVDWLRGLLLFDKKDKSLYTHDYNPIHHPLLKFMDRAALFYIFIDHDKNIWVSTSKADFYKYDPITRKVTAYSLTTPKQLKKHTETGDGTLLVHCFFEDDHHVLWLGTQNAGLLRYNKETDAFSQVTGREENTSGIQYNYDINCIFQDNEENIWLGTDKGITIFNPYRQYFQSVYHSETNPLTIPKYEIQECIQTKMGDILVCTWGGGMTLYDQQWHFKKNIHFSYERDEYNLLWNFIQNDDGNIWIGCQHGYIHIYDPVKETIQTIQPPEMNRSTIRCMTKDKKGNIWFGLHNGRIAKWDKAQNRYYAYKDEVPGIKQLFMPVQTIYIDTLDHCWAGTDYGLKEFDMDKMIYSAVYVPDQKNEAAISAGSIQDITGLNDSTLVIGTVYGGLNLFNTHSKKFTRYTTANGFPSNTVNNVKKDLAGNIWFTSDYGLYKYIPASGHSIRYNMDPGLVNASFKSGNFYELKDGRWVVPTLAEIISFNPDSLRQENNYQAVDITGLKVFNKDVFIDSFIQDSKPLTLSYQQNFISIEYGALSYSGLQEADYSYQMTGVDKDWVNAGTKRSASYTNLAPGEYTFKVKTENASSTPAFFNIKITPPFWKTIWFRLLVAAIIACIAYLLVKWRINMIRKEEKTTMLFNKEMAEMEMKALRSQMNPHFTFNCINSIDAFIHSNDKYNATLYLNKFARLLRNILDGSKQNTVSFSKDIETLKLYVELEELRHDNKFSTSYTIDNELLNSDYKVPALIVQPFVENAILHGLKNKDGNEGILTIDVKKVNDKIQYRISDNGIGRKEAGKIMQKKESHYGMQMSYDRIKLFNTEESASLQVNDLYKNGRPAGTEVIVNLNIV
jgi:ligand-binding sensor domain-containing protein